MLEKGKRHLLLSRGRHLGDLEFDGIVYPSNHITAIFTPTAAFDEVREIFEAAGIAPELITRGDRIALRRARARSDDAMERMDKLDLRIVDSNGAYQPVEGFVLNGDQAVFRYGFFREIRRHANDTFWNQIEGEVGPDRCREPGCGRLRISLGIYCKLHHFRMIVGEDYQGTAHD